MIMQFIKEVLFPAFGLTVGFVIVTLVCFLIVDTMTSIIRAADALERIADALESEEEDEEDEEEDKEEGGAK